MSEKLPRIGSLEQRHLVPEILDALPPDDPRARRSRADLRRINVMMRQTAIADALLARHLTVPAARPLRLLELGAGDGRAVLRLARRMARRRPDTQLTLLDMAPSVSDRTRAELASLGWRVDVVTADARSWLSGTDRHFDLALANLFLHHFRDAELLRLLRSLSRRADLVLATEPLRSALSLAGSRMVRLIGANNVTRHDAPASVRAGFRGTELGTLWTQGCGSVVEEATRFPFTHAFVGRSSRSGLHEVSHDQRAG